MPIYEYRCPECGVQVEKFWRGKPADAKASIPCPECSSSMEKQVTAAVHQFVHPASQTPGTLPPNTGTSDDYNYDKAIGRNATELWGKVEKRNTEKTRVILDERQAGRVVNRDQLVPTTEGSYRTITEGERVRTNQNRKTAFDIAQAAKKQGKGPGNKQKPE